MGIRGEKVRLERLTHGHLMRNDWGWNEYLSWVNDPDVNRWLSVGRWPQQLCDLKEFLERNQPPDHIVFAIYHYSDHIGNIKLDVDWLHRKTELGILIGKAHWGHGYGADATNTAVQYAFERLGVRKVTLGVVRGNWRAVAMYTDCGFVIEGILKDEAWCNGAYRDVLRMARWPKS